MSNNKQGGKFAFPTLTLYVLSREAGWHGLELLRRQEPARELGMQMEEGADGGAVGCVQSLRIDWIGVCAGDWEVFHLW